MGVTAIDSLSVISAASIQQVSQKTKQKALGAQSWVTVDQRQSTKLDISTAGVNACY